MKSVKDYRVENRYSQKQLAELAGINIHTYISKEQGRHEFLPSELSKLKTVITDMDFNQLKELNQEEA